MRKSIILFIFLHILSYAFPIYFKHIGMKEGLSQLSVISIRMNWAVCGSGRKKG